MKMFTTVILTAGSIGVMAAVGVGVSTVFAWLNTTEFDIGKKGKGGSGSRGREFGGGHKERMENLKGGRMRPTDL
jgi:hypothetical protein